MQQFVIRLPAHYFNRLTSAVTIRRRLSTTGPPLQIPLDRAATPIDGCDYKQWLVVMDALIGYPLRNQIIERYIQAIASALGSEEEAKRSIYSVAKLMKMWFIASNLCRMSDGFYRITMIMKQHRKVVNEARKSEVGPSSRLVDGEDRLPRYIPIKYSEYLKCKTKLITVGIHAFDEIRINI